MTIPRYSPSLDTLNLLSSLGISKNVLLETCDLRLRPLIMTRSISRSRNVRIQNDTEKIETLIKAKIPSFYIIKLLSSSKLSYKDLMKIVSSFESTSKMNLFFNDLYFVLTLNSKVTKDDISNWLFINSNKELNVFLNNTFLETGYFKSLNEVTKIIL